MSLMEALPGLAAHETIIPPVVVSFDAAAAQEIIRRAVEEVAMSYPAGTPWEWLRDNRPDVVAEIRATFLDLNRAYHEEQLDRVRAAADKYVRFHNRAWKIYEERPPVIERQELLFEAAAA